MPQTSKGNKTRSELPAILQSDRGAALWRIALDLMIANKCYVLRGGKSQRKELWPILRAQLRGLAIGALQSGMSDAEFMVRAKAKIMDARGLYRSQMQIDFHC